jgi:hypothetical protein
VRQQVKILAILHIVLSGLGVLAAVVVMAIFGGLAGLASLAGQAQDGMIGSAVLGFIGAAITIVVLLLSVPGFIAGIGLLSYQPWARILTIIISALELPGVPLHTALGIYGLWVLLSNEGAALFSHSEPRTA